VIKRRICALKKDSAPKDGFNSVVSLHHFIAHLRIVGLTAMPIRGAVLIKYPSFVWCLGIRVAMPAFPESSASASGLADFRIAKKRIQGAQSHRDSMASCILCRRSPVQQRDRSQHI
jgi:hypothetical protein